MKKFVWFYVVLILGSVAWADKDSVCNDLAHFSCAPGSYNDGTGIIKSEDELKQQVRESSDKAREEFSRSFEKIVDDPKNEYFHDLAESALGLDDAPDCNSEDAVAKAACRKNLVIGLTNLADRTFQSNRTSASEEMVARYGEMRDMNSLLLNGKFQGVLKTVGDKVNGQFDQSELAGKVADTFEQMKTLIVERLKALTIEDKAKALMIKKVSSIDFAGTSCDALTPKNSTPVAADLTNNAYYNPVQNDFHYCAGRLFQGSSMFQIAQTIAHEISHSIDPCVISTGPKSVAIKYSSTQDISVLESEYPIKNIIACLRNTRSIQAQRVMQSSSGQMGGAYGNYGNAFTPPTSQPATFCGNDQITESFADWMADEVLPSYIEKNYSLTTDQARTGYSNVFRSSCYIPNEVASVTDVHPTYLLRINKLILANPKIRRQMGCPLANDTQTIYCDPNANVAYDRPGPGSLQPQPQPSPTGSPSAEKGTK